MGSQRQRVFRRCTSAWPDAARSYSLRIGLAAMAAILPSCAARRPGETARPPSGGLQDEFLDRLIGDWRLTRSIRGNVKYNDVTARWVLGHQFVRIDMTDVARPPTYEALILIGFDAARGRYVAHWCDSFGGGGSADGYGARHGDVVEFRFDYPDGPFFNTFTWRRDAGAWTFRMENGLPDGSRRLFAEDSLVRR